MSKIFDALEHAKKRLNRFASTPGSLSPFQTHMEDEMMELYQTISLVREDGGAPIIEFIGSNPGEGTSTVAREFAKVVALRFCKNVLLLDADYTNPTQCLAFGVEDGKSLQGCVEDNQSPDAVCHLVPDSSLSVCHVAEDSSFIPTLCESEKLDHLWIHFRKNYGIVVVDSPPASVSSAGFDLIRKVDKVILVVEAEKTRWPVALNVKERVIKNGGTIPGVVFNKRKFYIPQWLYKRL
jgi:protein-tyrosine kinase